MGIRDKPSRLIADRDPPVSFHMCSKFSLGLPTRNLRLDFAPFPGPGTIHLAHSNTDPPPPPEPVCNKIQISTILHAALICQFGAHVQSKQRIDHECSASRSSGWWLDFSRGKPFACAPSLFQ